MQVKLEYCLNYYLCKIYESWIINTPREEVLRQVKEVEKYEERILMVNLDGEPTDTTME
jgi:hypothetical protein